MPPVHVTVCSWGWIITTVWSMKPLVPLHLRGSFIHKNSFFQKVGSGSAVATTSSARHCSGQPNKCTHCVILIAVSKDKMIAAMITFQSCKILSQNIINRCAVFCLINLQAHGTVIPGSYFTVSLVPHRQYCKVWFVFCSECPLFVVCKNNFTFLQRNMSRRISGTCY